MISWSWIKSQNINFEPGITCRLKCAGCNMRSDGMSKKNNPEKFKSQAWDRRYNIPLEKYKVIFEVFKGYEFCGNLSDQIYNPDFIDTLKYMKGRRHSVVFHTNGSGKSKEWWTQVFSLCKDEDWKWTFALDGLPKDSHIYRINQDGEQVWEMMKLGMEMEMNILWQWIVFNYNQYDIDQGKMMAEHYGMRFDYFHSTRWDTPFLKSLKPDEKHTTIARKYTSTGGILVPDCLATHLTKDIMFNSMGYFIPCCEKDQYVESMEKRGFYQKKFHIDNLHTVEDIKNVFMSDTWQDFWQGLINDPSNAPAQCQQFCRKLNYVKDPKGFV